MVAKAALHCGILLDAMTNLKGIGHFTIGFLVGYLVFLVLLHISNGNKQGQYYKNVALYGPFIPFVLATVAAIPYVLQVSGLIRPEATLSTLFIFMLLYPVLERSSFLNLIFGNFYVDIIMMALIYVHLVVRYIQLIKQTRAQLAK
jgi:hypothetical protein